MTHAATPVLLKKIEEFAAKMPDQLELLAEVAAILTEKTAARYLDEVLPGLAAVTASDAVRTYSTFNIAYDGMDAAKKRFNLVYDKMSKELIPDALRREGVKTMTLSGIGRVTISHRYSCSMLDKDAGMAWLKDNGAGDLIQPTVNSSSLSAYAKNLLEEEGKELPSDIFKVGTSPYTSITRK